MGERASYELHIDWDRDGFLCDGVQTTDSLNLLPSPVRFHGLYAYKATSNSSFTVVREESAYGTRLWRIDTGGDSGGGLYIGQNESTPTLYVIPVVAGATYRATCWMRLVSAVGNADIRLRCTDPVSGSSVATANVTVGWGWQQVTMTFTSDPTQVWARLDVIKRTNTDRVVLDVAGMMLIDGSAPAVFNAGDESNAYDDIWAFCEGLTFSYGAQQYTEAVAPASSMVVTVNNIDGVFSPENPPTERSYGSVANTVPPVIDVVAVAGIELQGDDGRWLRTGFFSRGMLARLRATYGGVTETLFIGTLDSVRPTVGPDGTRRAVLMFVDPMAQLNTVQYYPPLQEDVTTDQVLETLFDSGALLYPYPAEYWLLGLPGASELGASTWLYASALTDFDTGDTTLAFAGDTTGSGKLNSAMEFIRDTVYGELGGRFFWDAKTGKFKFFSRTRDILYRPTVESPGAMELDEPPDYVWGDDLLNRINVTYYPRVVGAVGDVLYTLGNAPLTISAGQTRTMTVRYQVTDASNATVAGKDMITPVSGVDYTATLNSDGTGGDVTASLLVTCNFYALSADLTLVNTSGSALYIQTFQLRGTPLISYRAVQANAYDGVSIVQQGEYQRTIDLPALGDALLAESYANYLVQRYKQPIGRLSAATVIANRDADTMTRVLGMAIGDHIELYDSFVNNQATKVLVTAMTHTITPMGLHRLRMTVEPLDRYLYWILGDTTLSVLGTTTRLSF